MEKQLIGLEKKANGDVIKVIVEYVHSTYSNLAITHHYELDVDLNSYTPYTDLTEALVLSWVESYDAEIESQLDTIVLRELEQIQLILPIEFPWNTLAVLPEGP